MIIRKQKAEKHGNHNVELIRARKERLDDVWDCGNIFAFRCH
jgi:hypothetical protein